MTGPEAALERTFRESSGRAVATLARLFGDIDLAEEAVQEAFAVAIERWPVTGLPPNPGGWIVTTARNKAVDRLRRESSRSGREAQAVALLGDPEPMEVEPVPDEGNSDEAKVSDEATAGLRRRPMSGPRRAAGI